MFGPNSSSASSVTPTAANQHAGACPQDNEQEAFWRGQFGQEYIQRNLSADLLPTNLAFFSKVFAQRPAPRSILEVGANMGQNLSALNVLFPEASLTAFELNPQAIAHLKQALPQCRVIPESFRTASLQPWPTAEWVLIKGVLIHQPPEALPAFYDRLFASTQRWLCVTEYYHTTPVALPYRGHENKLFKRDFAGELLARFPDQLRLIDYGFIYHRDPAFPQDDLTWFLLEKHVP
jgi:pseudaminic acid biosynthesis-associated methylase